MEKKPILGNCLLYALGAWTALVPGVFLVSTIGSFLVEAFDNQPTELFGKENLSFGLGSICIYLFILLIRLLLFFMESGRAQLFFGTERRFFLWGLFNSLGGLIGFTIWMGFAYMIGNTFNNIIVVFILIPSTFGAFWLCNIIAILGTIEPGPGDEAEKGSEADDEKS